MPDTPAFSATFAQRVAEQFADRPTLRQVVAVEGMAILQRHYPMLATLYPQVASLSSFNLLRSADDSGVVRSEPLVDHLLEAYLRGDALNLNDGDQLRFTAPGREGALLSVVLGSGQAAGELRLSTLNDDFDDLLDNLTQRFRWAQVAFWNAAAGDEGVPRTQWLQQVLKAVMALNIDQQPLDDDEAGLLRGLLVGKVTGLGISAVEVTLSSLDRVQRLWLPGLLVSAERKERRVLLWCLPTGRVQSFDSLPAFAIALRDELVQTRRFESLTWAQVAVEQEPFGYQAGLLLEGVCQRVGLLQRWDLHGIDELETRCAELSDLAQDFTEQGYLNEELPTMPVPKWLDTASTADRFEYQVAVLELAARQALSQGRGALDGIEDLHAFAARRLREQMRLDHPQQAPYDPDILSVSIAQRVEQGDPLVTPVRLVPLRTASLTEYAVSRLRDDQSEVASALRDASGERLDGWMNLDYLERLLTDLDIGGSYPLYVQRQLQSADAGQLQRFADQWRGALLFDALRAKVEGHLDEAMWRVLAGFCRSSQDMKQYLSIAPLALCCSPQASSRDEVAGMFLIKLHEPDTWILYRPLYPDQAVLAFADLGALMARVREPGDLQQSILEWLGDDVRAVYANGGFAHPHLHSGLSAFAHLLGGAAATLEDLLQAERPPASAAPVMWLADVDVQMYQARGRTLVALAARQSVSNAQQRWALVSRFGWMLFNLVTPLLPGPVGMVAWLVTALISVKDDVQALKTGSAAERAMAIADLLNNVAMALLHVAGNRARTPAGHAPRLTQASLPVEQSISLLPEERPLVVEGRENAPALPDFSWRNRQGVELLTDEARRRLLQYRATVSLEGLPAQAQWPVKGLFKIADNYYARLDGHPYEVQVAWGSVRVVGADGGEGPWLRPSGEGWRIDVGGMGGMPPKVAKVRAATASEFAALLDERKQNDASLRKADALEKLQLAKISDFDTAYKAYSREKAEYERSGINSIARDNALTAQWSALKVWRKRVVGTIKLISLIQQKSVPVAVRNDAIFTELRQVKFSRFLDQAGLPELHGAWRKVFLDNDMRLFNRLGQLLDYDELIQLRHGLSDVPSGEAARSRYQTFRASLGELAEVEERAVQVSERFDRYLLATLDDPLIRFENKQVYIENAISQRPYSTHSLRMQLTVDLAELTLDRLLLGEDNAAQLVHAQRALVNRAFKEAGFSHGELEARAVAVDERVEVLETALRQYDAALGKADYLAGLADTAVNEVTLGKYRAQVLILREAAARELAQALGERDQSRDTPPPRANYRQRPGPRKVIRMGKGRAVVGELETEGGKQVLSQRDPITGARASAYEQRDGQWVALPSEVPAQPAPAPKALRQRGRELIKQIDTAINHAGRYLGQPNTLADLLDWRLEDMEQVARALKDVGASEQGLVTELQGGITRLRLEKQRLLIDAYTSTPRPSGEGLKYLKEHAAVEITPGVVRKRLGAGNFLDIYEIRRSGQSKGLWEAHFHYKQSDTPPRGFFKGHLKLWSQRKLGREAQLEQARTSQEWIEIYRGDLRAEQMEGVIPFD